MNVTYERSRMNKKLNILHLEDSRNDAELIKETLAAGGMECDIVPIDNRDDFTAALERERFDLILADYNLPAFDGLSALEIASAKGYTAPFLFVTGTMGEEIAVDSLRHGATDYIVKSNLARLVPAVKRALYEKEVRIARESAEQALRESEDRYRMLFNNSMDAVMLTLPEGRILSANPAACEMFGRTEEEICAIGRNGLVAPDDPRLAKFLEERERTGRMSGELLFIRKDGSRFPGEASSLSFKDSQGALRTSMVIHDITDRKQKEEELGKLNRTLQAKSRSSLAMMRATDEQSYLSEVCRSIVEDCGHALVWIGFANDDAQRTVSPVAHAGLEDGYLESMKITWADTERGRGPVGTAIRTGKPVEFRSTTVDARFAPWREEALKRGYAAIVSIPLQTEEKTFGALNIYSRQQDPFSGDEVRLLSDLAADLSYGIAAIRLRTAQRLAEDALRASEEKYRHLVENLGKEYFFYQHDTNGVITYVSPSVAAMLGYVPQEIASHYSEYLTENPVNREVAQYTDLSLRGIQQPPYAVEVLHQDGSVRWLEVSEFPLLDQSGNVVAVEGIARDITERRGAEEALRDSEKRYRQMVDSALVGIYRSTGNGEFLFVNDALARIFEYGSAGEMLSSHVQIRYKRPGDRASFLDLLSEKKRILSYEVDVPTKNGKLRTIVISAVLEAGFISGMVIDITEQKKLEAQLRHSQKMEAVGSLAGGIAHDFNNILNVIIGYGSMVLGSLAANGPAQDKMREVLAAADRATSLTKRLLSFSRKDVAELKQIRVSDVVLNMERMLARIIGEDIDFRTDIQDQEAVILADMSQLEQVLMNLAANARDAMPRGGELTIRTGRKELDDSFVAAHGHGVSGRYAVVAVSDTGTGIDAETQKKIFEPFFTTKGIGAGTGLGLSIAYGIVKQHKGFIEVSSEPGKGTTFEILLPLSETTAEQKRASDALLPSKGGTETILVAEDDGSARKLIQIVLESFGYSVITAEDGEDAVGKFRENKDRVQLVILDLIMPKMNGKEAGDTIEMIRPGIKMLYMSGYAMDPARNQSLLVEGMQFMQKPLSPQKLLAKVREVLNAP